MCVCLALFQSVSGDSELGGHMPRRGSHINVNVAPTIIENDTPEIRKYKKRFNSDILCAALWGKKLTKRFVT